MSPEISQSLIYYIVLHNARNHIPTYVHAYKSQAFNKKHLITLDAYCIYRQKF